MLSTSCSSICGNFEWTVTHLYTLSCIKHKAMACYTIVCGEYGKELPIPWYYDIIPCEYTLNWHITTMYTIQVIGWQKQTSCAHKGGQYTPALITTHLIQKYPIKISFLIIFSKSFRNHIFGKIFGHQRAKNGARNTKMNRDQETHPIRVNAKFVMNGTNNFFKNSGNPIFNQIFGHKRAENEAWNRKMYRDQETYPIKINDRYEMNWANSFFKKFRKPHFQPNIWPPEGQNFG